MRYLTLVRKQPTEVGTESPGSARTLGILGILGICGIFDIFLNYLHY